MKHKLLTFRDSWPWALVNGLATGVIGKALWYNYTQGSLKTSALFVMLTVLAGFYGITLYRYAGRLKFLKSIRYYLDNGIAVVYVPPELHDKHINDNLREGMNTVMEDARDFWTDWSATTGPNSGISLKNAYDGVILTITNKPFRLNSITSSRAGAPMDKFYGISHLNRITVMYDGDRVANNKSFYRLLRHEAGHRCLTHLQIHDLQQTIHHEIFKSERY